MPEVMIHLFGRFQVLVNGEPVPDNEWRGQMPRTLLQYIAARPDGQATGDELIEALWSHLPVERARHNLLEIVRRLRSVLAARAAGLPPAELLPHTGTGYRLPDFVRTDLGTLHQVFHDVRHLQVDDPEALLARLDEMVLPDPDSLLMEQPYADWAIAARGRARQQYMAIRLTHADLLLRAGRSRSALACLRDVLEKEPVRESTARLAMQIAVDLGDRVAALDIFDRCRRALAEELGVDPMPETLAVHSRILHTDLGAVGVDVPVQRRSLTNLPAQPTSFVGRAPERAAVGAGFASTRLLTLTGAGGTGKTRLALNVAADLLPARADGVWLVELAPLTDPDLVPRVVASTLGLDEQPGVSPLDALAEHLQSKQMLLMLDNCEHLINACAALADGLLRGCPDLWILATSREALGIPGERLWPVPPLRLPDHRHLPPVDRFREYDALALFLERTAAMMPGLSVNAANAGTIARICHRLDGMPLAIELAAALVKVLSLDQIDARLHERFRLLTGGSRTAPPRQKTLRGTMDWSYDLLSEAERAMWRRLSVFAGGFTLAAAEAVCAAAAIPAGQVLELLYRLVEKSLVTAEESEGEKRFRLLETIRQYGLEKLEEAGESEAVRARHYDWCLGMAEAVAAEQWGPQWATGYDRLEREHDNLRAALDWCRTVPGGVPKGVRLAWVLLHFWDTWGHVSEGRQRVAELLASAGGPLEPAVRALGLTVSGSLAILDEDLRSSISFADLGLSIWRELGDQHGAARCLLVLGLAAHYSGNFGRAVVLLEESLTLFRAVNDASFVRQALFYLAEALVSQGEYARARQLHEESLALKRAANCRVLIFSLLRLARLAALEGDPVRAWALARESAPFWDLRFQRGIARSLEDMAAVAISSGQAERAACLAGAADALRRSIGLTGVGLLLTDREGVPAEARSRLGEQAFAAAWSHGKSLSPEQAVAFALTEPDAH